VPSTAGQIQATAIAAGTGFGIASINNQLDRTLADLGEEVIQLTTVDPGESYAGRIVLAKLKSTALPTQVHLTINWNGEAYPFTFQIARPGTAAPTFAAITRPSDLTDFSASQGASGSTIAGVAAPPIVPAATAVTPAAPGPATDAKQLGKKPEGTPAAPAMPVGPAGPPIVPTTAT
jgi:hypothetical protein